VAHVGIRDIQTEFWWRKLKERDYLEDLGIGGSIKLKENGRVGLHSSG
jgi:hypothetical protein